MDGDRHRLQLGTGEHHHRRCRRSGPGRRQRAEELGMAGMPEAGLVERLLVDRVGDDGAGVAGAHVADRARDRFDHRRRVAAVETARLGIDRCGETDHGQRAVEGRDRLRRVDRLDRAVEAESGARAPQAGPDRRGSRTGAGRSCRRPCHAASVTSGPMPPGSPMVRASGRMSVTRLARDISGTG